MTTTTQGLVHIFVRGYDRSSDRRLNRRFYARTTQELLDTLADFYIYEYSPELTEPGDDRWANSEYPTILQILTDSAKWRTHATYGWKYRETERINTGEYKRFPFSLLNTMTGDGWEVPETHYLHLPVAESAGSDMIAYTESEDKGYRDKQTVVRFGRYLKKTFPKISDESIQEYVQALRASQTPKTYDFHLTTDKEVINQIFETRMSACGNGSGLSCMCGKFSGLENRPYHVYANSPDVAVAYITETGHDTPMARSVVSTRKHQWVRIYAMWQGDNIEHETLCSVFRDRLSAEGFKSGNIEGDRLSKVFNNRGTMIGPYIDNISYVNDIGDWLEASNDDDGEYTASNTDGTFGDKRRYSCADCEERFSDESDLFYVGESYVCRDCIDNNYTAAIVNRYGDTEYIRDADVVSACNGRHYSPDYTDHLIDIDGDWHTEDCGHWVSACDDEYYLLADNNTREYDGDYHTLDCDHIVTACDGEIWQADDTTEVDGVYHIDNCDCPSEIANRIVEHEESTTL